MVKYEGIIVHFGELWLKGRNRHTFVQRLYSNIKYALKDEDYLKIENLRDRFLIVLDKKSNLESIEKSLSSVFGISWFAPVVTCDNKLDEILKTSNKLLTKKETVRIVPHRSMKNLDFDSSDIVSYFIKNSKKLKFEIDKDSEKDLFINIARNNAFLYKEKIQGPKGLPVGTSGNAVILLSGGIDSPVASYYAMKRGLNPIYMHVHAFNSNNDEKLSKIKDLTELLSNYSCNSKIYYIPGHVFQASAMKMPKKYELVLFKFFLYKLAEQIALKEDADCIVSGESLGQVASQTLSNLKASEYSIKQFIMRPLIGLDKQEIINVAKTIGTFDISIRSYRDVCSIAAKNPATKSTPQIIAKLWKDASMKNALETTMKKKKVIDI
ncbi:MAG: tRNA uracil 4-sulfurtransferase ThiI [Candidatus Micrarchaeaceae archaeon]|jgi:tRNA uracil 4-sulfurtransferase